MNGLTDLSTWIGFGGVVTLAAMFFRAGGVSEQLRNVVSELRDTKPKLDAFVTSTAVHEERLKKVEVHDKRIEELEEEQAEARAVQADQEARIRQLEKYLSPARGTPRQGGSQS